MKLKHPINAHKGLTALVILAMMGIYHNFSTAPWIYLTLHGGYGFLWLLKDRIYPDKRWEEDISLGLGFSLFLFLGAYWIAPWLLISSGLQPSNFILAIAVFLNIVGVFLHYSSDAQKYWLSRNSRGGGLHVVFSLLAAR